MPRLKWKLGDYYDDIFCDRTRNPEETFIYMRKSEIKQCIRQLKNAPAELILRGTIDKLKEYLHKQLLSNEMDGYEDFMNTYIKLFGLPTNSREMFKLHPHLAKKTLFALMCKVDMSYDYFNLAELAHILIYCEPYFEAARKVGCICIPSDNLFKKFSRSYYENLDGYMFIKIVYDNSMRYLDKSEPFQIKIDSDVYLEINMKQYR